MLLDSCTEVDGELFLSALKSAAEYGHDRVVQLLLERRTGVALQDGYLEIALQAASGHFRYIGYDGESSYTNLLNMLLSEGATINQQGDHYGNALQAAASVGNFEIMDILLENGADTNAQGGYFGSVLQALASRTRRFGPEDQSSKGQQLITTLLDRGVDVNAEGGEYGTALQAAVFGGLEETVITLLERGAKINHQGGEFGTAFHAVVFQNYLDMMQILLRYGVDIGTPDQYGFTVSYWVQNDMVLNRRREVRNLVNKVMKGSAANLVDVVTRRKNIVSLLEQLKQVTQGGDRQFYHLGKALLYDGCCEAAAYCFQKQYSIEIRERKSYGDAPQHWLHYCFSCYKHIEDDKYHICKVCRDFVICSKCVEAPSDKICKTHGFLEFKWDNVEETKTDPEEDRSLRNWIDQMLTEYRI